ncbi:toxin-antitoxin system TumE family protein [Thermococcus thioreducens]|uniref:Uncharacterized protein n=1 Tax=Thermococcus thioreducens TaxID=277988 RepID=A0A0Q2QNL2_9EURY|nr:DUF6516 family protein [Thermococcus thioreducens]ASJ12994.1 hypothetical protein A3L14_08895 [Thermococcus thioreducens]KQH81461.1 hypothetical protein AMR53_11215 [Thermococcus thioreducens]SEV82521.1 hypothetical protein SAMN05216170_0161 [Thermococcus thioreducens]
MLEKSLAVKSYEILDYKQGDSFYFLKIRVELIDRSVLYIREFVSEEDYNYSFQWQKNGKLIVRWDNAPHHKNVETFPHHKHVGSKDNVRPSKEVSLEDVLRIIEEKLKR